MSTQVQKHGASKLSDRDTWQTPQWLYDWLDERFTFSLDVAASHDNFKCHDYYTKEDNALEKNWFGHTAFCNPPYSRGLKEKFFEKGWQECKENGTTTVYVVPALPSEGWFPHHASEIIWITGGRVAFINPETGEEVKGAPAGTCVIIFDPTWIGTTTYRRVDRNTIKQKYSR